MRITINTIKETILVTGHLFFVSFLAEEGVLTKLLGIRINVLPINS